jgi:predicted HD phosphohydrolase
MYCRDNVHGPRRVARRTDPTFHNVLMKALERRVVLEGDLKAEKLPEQNGKRVNVDKLIVWPL